MRTLHTLTPAALFLLTLGFSQRGEVSVPLAAAGLAGALCLAPSRRRLALAVFAGLLWGGAHPAARSQSGFTELTSDRPVVVVGRLTSPVRGLVGGRRAWLRATAVLDRGRNLGAGADILVQIPDDLAPVGADDADRLEAYFEPGTRLRVRGFLGRPTPAANGAGELPGPWILRPPSGRFVDRLRPAPRLLAQVGTVRRRIEARLDRFLFPGAVPSDASEADPSRGLALVRALALGDATHLEEDVVRSLRARGHGHLLAVSGLHLGGVALLAFCLLVPFGDRVPRSARWTWMLAALWGYALLVGARPSVLRAAAMASIALVAIELHRPPHALAAWTRAAAGLAAWRPVWVFDLGFQASFAATAGLLATTDFARSLGVRGGGNRGTFARSLRVVSLSLLASAAAQLATGPLFWPLGAGVHPLAPLVDLFWIPWLTVCLGISVFVAGLAALPAALLETPSGWAVLEGGVGLVEMLALPLDVLAADRPGALTRVSMPPSVGRAMRWWVPGLAVGLSLPRLRRATLALVLSTLALGVTGSEPAASGSPDRLAIEMLDVGQGDAILLRDGRSTVLVDGGGWRRGDIASRILLPALAERGIGRLDAIVLTHPDRDHCGGLLGLVDALPVGELWASPGWDAPCVARLAAKVPWRPLWNRSDLRQGTRPEPLRVGRWRFEVLWPLAASRPRDGRESNDRSLVLRASAGGARILLTGDLEAGGERRLLRAVGEAAVRAEILKVGHHGSRSSTSASFLEAVDPELALISAGYENRFGHPHADVLSRLAERRVTIWRTDRDGAVRIESSSGTSVGPSRTRSQARSRVRSQIRFRVQTTTSRPVAPPKRWGSADGGRKIGR